MTIDNITVTMRVYTCCKCKHRWTNWDHRNQKDGPIPLNCPHCRNIRWNQTYTPEDMVLIKRLEEQHVVKKAAESRKSKYAAMLGKDENITNDYFDFIAYDFLTQIKPEPDIFEIKQVLKIPKSKMEERHELMLSIIHDRVTNAEKYEKEHYSKFSRWSERSKTSNYRMNLPIGELLHNVNVRRRMSGCKHKEEVDVLMHLYKHPYLDNNNRWMYEHMYSNDHYLPFQMHELERLPGSEAIEAEAEKRLNAAVKAAATAA